MNLNLDDPVRFSCPRCGAGLTGPCSDIGAEVDCTKCGSTIVVPPLAPPVVVKPICPPNLSLAVYLLAACGVGLLFVPFVWVLAIPLLAILFVFAVITNRRYSCSDNFMACTILLFLATCWGIRLAFSASESLQQAFR